MPEPERTPTGQATVTVAGAAPAPFLTRPCSSSASRPAGRPRPRRWRPAGGPSTRSWPPWTPRGSSRPAAPPAAWSRTRTGSRGSRQGPGRLPGRRPAHRPAGPAGTAGQVAAAAVAGPGPGPRARPRVRGRRPGAVAAAARRRPGGRAARPGTRRWPAPPSARSEIKEALPPPDACPMRLMAAEAAPAGLATEPGETTIWAAVTVTWALHPG